MAERVRVREIDDDEGRRLVRIIRRGTGSVVTWRRAQMVLLSAQGMAVPKIAEVSFTSADRVRDVIHNFGHRRLRLALPEVRRWSAEEVHPARTPRNREGGSPAARRRGQLSSTTQRASRNRPVSDKGALWWDMKTSEIGERS